MRETKREITKHSQQNNILLQSPVDKRFSNRFTELFFGPLDSSEGSWNGQYSDLIGGMSGITENSDALEVIAVARSLRSNKKIERLVNKQYNADIARIRLLFLGVSLKVIPHKAVWDQNPSPDSMKLLQFWSSSKMPDYFMDCDLFADNIKLAESAWTMLLTSFQLKHQLFIIQEFKKLKVLFIFGAILNFKEDNEDNFERIFPKYVLLDAGLIKTDSDYDYATFVLENKKSIMEMQIKATNAFRRLPKLFNKEKLNEISEIIQYCQSLLLYIIDPSKNQFTPSMPNNKQLTQQNLIEYQEDMQEILEQLKEFV